MTESSSLIRKTALIVAVSFSYPRTYRPKTLLTGHPLLRTLHAQSVHNVADIQCMILEHISRAIRFSGDEYLDLIFVNNDVGNASANAWLNLFHGLQLGLGRVIVCVRENAGWSYGAYSYASKLFLKDYDYFVFTEDDVYVGSPGTLSKCINYFNLSASNGFLSFQGLSSSSFDDVGPSYFHARGGVGLTSARVLCAVQDLYGRMPYFDGHSSSEYYHIIRQGEVAFTNVIFRLGFEIVQIPRYFPPLVQYDYDFRRNINSSLYPGRLESFLHLSLYHSRRFCYLLYSHFSIASTLRRLFGLIPSSSK